MTLYGECWIEEDQYGSIIDADRHVYLKAESHEPKIYFKLEGTTNFRKLLESLSSILREHHGCGAINCSLVIRGFVNIRNKPEYREYVFALIAIAEGDKAILKTDYDRFGEYCLQEKEKARNLKEIRMWQRTISEHLAKEAKRNP